MNKNQFKKENATKKKMNHIEQVLDKLQKATETSSRTSTEQALVPSINYINNTNNLNISKLENASELEENFKNENSILENDENQKEKSSAKKERSWC
jgi:hypothetical protein